MRSSSAVSLLSGLLFLVGASSGSVIPVGGFTATGYSYVEGNTLLAAPAVVAGPPVAVAPAVVAHPVVGPAPVAAPAVVLRSGPLVPAAPVVATLGQAAPAPGSVSLKEAAPEPAQPEQPASTAAPAEQPASSPAPVSEEPDKVDAAPAVNPYLPVQETPEVAAARAQHLAAVQETKSRDAAVGTEEPATPEPTEAPETPEPSEAPSSPAPSTPAPAPAPLLPAAVPAVRVAGPLPGVPLAPFAPVAAVAAPAVARVTSLAAPSVGAITAPVAVAPAIAVAPVAPLVSASQYRVQDELGQYAFGHAGGPNSREEIKTADGITRGGYAYVDAHGLVQNARYVADPVNGFRVAATNLPVQPAPTYIQDTPEVAEAKAALLKAQQEHIAKL